MYTQNPTQNFGENPLQFRYSPNTLGRLKLICPFPRKLAEPATIPFAKKECNVDNKTGY